MKVYYFLIILTFLVTIGQTQAVSLGSAGLEELNVISSHTDANIVLSPENPPPFTQVEATLQLSSNSLGTSDIAWILNGEVATSGKGKSKFTFNTGDVGEKAEISAIIQTKGRPLFTARAELNPSRLTLLKEAETYTPPFYKGRSRYSAGSFVRISVLAEIAKEGEALYTPEELTYRWSKNGVLLSKYSGLGKSALRIKGPGFLGKDLVSVEIRDDIGKTRGQIATYVESTTPQIILYEKRPLIGLGYFNALRGGMAMSGPNIHIVAEPYFIDASTRNSTALKYIWQIENEVLPLQEPQSELAFNIDNSTDKKKLNITIGVSHLENFTQSTKSTVRVKLGDNASSSIF